MKMRLASAAVAAIVAAIVIKIAAAQMGVEGLLDMGQVAPAVQLEMGGAVAFSTAIAALICTNPCQSFRRSALLVLVGTIAVFALAFASLVVGMNHEYGTPIANCIETMLKFRIPFPVLPAAFAGLVAAQLVPMIDTRGWFGSTSEA